MGKIDYSYASPYMENPEIGYIAIPYSHENREIMERRFEFVTRLSGDWAARSFVPFSPITHTHPMAERSNLPRTWDFWKVQDLPFLDFAENLYVIDARGVEESTGVQSEIKHFSGEVKHVDPLKTTAMNVIGVSGKKRSGKDFMATMLAEEYGYEKYALADPIKAACKEIFLFSDEQVDGDEKGKTDGYWQFTPREALQHFGTDAFREEFGSDVWVRNLMERLRLWLPKKAIVTDVRFPNEVEAIQNIGGSVIRIDASKRLDHDDDHASETALDDFDGFDRVIKNNGSKEEFERKIESFTNTNLI